jgi:hypothetical protein
MIYTYNSIASECLTSSTTSKWTIWRASTIADCARNLNYETIWFGLSLDSVTIPCHEISYTPVVYSSDCVIES